MLESLKYSIDIPAAIAMLAFFVVVGTVGLWYVRKTTGRSYRDMFGVLAGALIFIVLMVPSFYFFHERIFSPDKHLARRTTDLLSLAYIPVAVSIWWILNKLIARKPLKTKK